MKSTDHPVSASAAERALERTAYELTENMPAGTYTMVLEPGAAMARFSFMSSRFLEYTGLEREEALSDPMKAFACVHPEDFDEWVRKNAECFEKRVPFSEECRVVVRGEVRWILAESVPRELGDGSIVWEGVLTDITRRKLAEKALASSEAKLRLTLDHVPVPMAISEEGAGITFLNREFVRNFGYTLEDIPTVERWAELAYPDPDYRRKTFEIWDAAVAAAPGRGGVVEPMEFRVVRKDGEVRDVVFNAIAIDGLLIVGLLDITDRKRAEAELAGIREAERLAEVQHRTELERKLKTSLTASAVAHEINQPLSRILLTSQIVMEKGSGGGADPMEPYLKELTADAQRVVSTIEKMKELLRNVEGPKSRLDLRGLAEDVVLYNRPLAESAGVEVSLSLPARRIALLGDADQIQIALKNLLKNAIEAAGELPKGRPRRVMVAVRSRKKCPELVVEDSGPGLTTAEIKELLLRSTKPKGSGLGLFIVQTTMENHGGRLAIGRSKLGGAEFRMVFPSGAAAPFVKKW
jgi:PAS domain S-box-containing protein